MSQSAYVLRIAPSGVDLLPECLNDNQITIGWSRVTGLMNDDLTWEQFRQIIADEYYAEETSLRKAGAAAGNLWRFLRAMELGDLIVVPYWNGFYIAEVKAHPTHDPKLLTSDSSYRRDVEWLNAKQPIPRSFAKARLQSLMKYQGTSVDATAALEDIKNCLKLSKSGEKPTFGRDFQASLVEAALKEMRSGRIENFGFERLLETVFRGLGAEEVRIVPRNKDKGADLLATFVVAGAISQLIAIQAKHWGGRKSCRSRCGSAVDQWD